jgi:PAS domain S-box-containing protein
MGCGSAPARTDRTWNPDMPPARPPSKHDDPLRANGPSMALLFGLTEEGVWFIDNELRTTDANPAMCRMLGRTLAQMLGTSIFDHVDEVNAAVFRQHIALRSQGRADGYEITLRRADGQPVYCYNNATPVFDADGLKIGAVGMFSNISALKHAEQQARRANEQLARKSAVLETTLESLTQGVLSLDASGHVNAWNQRLLELLQLPEALMQGRPTLGDLLAYQLAHGHFGDDAASIAHATRESHLAQAGAGLVGLRNSYQRRRPDGTVLEVQTRHAADGSVTRTFTDVTASVLAEQALRDSEVRFRTLADSAPALIWQSAADGGAAWFNQRWQDYTGCTSQQELQRNWDRRIHPDDLERCRALYVDAVVRRALFSAEYRLRRADGCVAWIADIGVPQHGPDGRFEGHIGYGWDITERKAAEAALIAARDEAERASRAKSEFLSRMSHELRTPLNAVLGFAQLLENDAEHPLSALQRARVQELLRGGRHLLSLINEVLDLSRIEAGTPQVQLQAVDLGAAVGAALQMVASAAAERGIRVEQHASPAGAMVLADPVRLKQVLINLLSNAIKYNRPGGRVGVCWRADGEGWRLDVEDSGPGLDAEQQGRLFQAFERLGMHSAGVEGLGIGLALSKWLVELMHGEIGVCSMPGLGSTFWLRLKSSGPQQPAPPAGAAFEAAAAPRDVQRRTVLYIEDNAVNQILMEGMLAQRPGLLLRVASLPETGLAMAREIRPALVLLDIQLPGIDGFEVQRRLRADPATRDVPVVAVSANAMPADLAEAAAAGFADYVTKPLDLQRLLAVVDRILGC